MRLALYYIATSTKNTSRKIMRYYWLPLHDISSYAISDVNNFNLLHFQSSEFSQNEFPQTNFGYYA